MPWATSAGASPLPGASAVCVCGRGRSAWRGRGGEWNLGPPSPRHCSDISCPEPPLRVDGSTDGGARRAYGDLEAGDAALLVIADADARVVGQAPQGGVGLLTSLHPALLLRLRQRQRQLEEGLVGQARQQPAEAPRRCTQTRAI